MQNIQGGDGSIVPTQANGIQAADTPSGSTFGKGFVLAANTTYYAYLGGAEAAALAAQIRWDAAIVLTSVAIEDCVFNDVPKLDTVLGNWIKQDATPPVKANSTAGGTVTGQTLAVAGGTAGGCTFSLHLWGNKRARMAIVVGATGGAVRVGGASKV